MLTKQEYLFLKACDLRVKEQLGAGQDLEQCVGTQIEGKWREKKIRLG